MRIAGLPAMLLLLGLQLAAGSGACAGGQGRGPDLRTVRGVVRVVGNEPFARVVVTSAGDAADRTDYLIEGPLAAELRARHQGRAVTLEGRDAPPSAPGFRRGFAPTRILESAEGR